ncbi:MAG TPA: tyrosine-protein phosphatase, partial [Gaiellaceae bacterium]|nr:tyrosine-protein phosphatase [Gaiellaceae bacterium]
HSMHDAYLGMIHTFPDSFARALTLLGQADPPVAVHCAGGRDRTGIACGMALWLAGAEPDAIAADHALSDESWAPHHATWIAEAPDEEERERRARINRPAGRTLAEVLERVERETGIRRLLLDAGADPAALDRLVERLRTNP